MKSFLALILLVPLVSCATPDNGLLQADASQVKDPRRTIERGIQKADVSKFFYYDRANKLVYSLGFRINGFKFKRVDVGKLREDRPDIVEIAQCAGGKRCSNASFDSCKASISLPLEVTADRQNQIVATLKSRGYPVIRASFLRGNVDSNLLEVQYFAECSFIENDIAENFPDLMPRAEAR